MTSTSLSSTSVASRSRFQTLSLDAAKILGFALLTALVAKLKIPLPFTPVPLTLQSLVVVLAGASLGAHRGLLSQLALIGFGCLGFSVFSTSGPGYLALVGPTGGYIVGFLLTAFVTGKLQERGQLNGFFRSFLFLFAASLFLFIPGVIWLKIFTARSWGIAIEMGFLPFIVGDLVKTFAATSILSAAYAAKKSN